MLRGPDAIRPRYSSIPCHRRSKLLRLGRRRRRAKPEAKSMHHRDCNLRNHLSASSHSAITIIYSKGGILPVHTVSLCIRREMWRYSLSEKRGLMVCGCVALLVCPQSRLEQTPWSSTTLLLLITTSFTETIQWPRDAVQTLPSA